MVDDNVKKYACLAEKFAIKNHELLKGLYKIFFGIILLTLPELRAHSLEGNRTTTEIKVKLTYVSFHLVCPYVAIFMYKFAFSDLAFNPSRHDYGDTNYVTNLYS